MLRESSAVLLTSGTAVGMAAATGVAVAVGAAVGTAVFLLATAALPRAAARDEAAVLSAVGDAMLAGMAVTVATAGLEPAGGVTVTLLFVACVATKIAGEYDMLAINQIS